MRSCWMRSWWFCWSGRRVVVVGRGVVVTTVVWACAGTTTARRMGFVQDFGSNNVEAAAAPTVAVVLSISLRSERGATGPRRSRRRIMTKRRHRAESGFMRIPVAGPIGSETTTITDDPRQGTPNKRQVTFSRKCCRFASVNTSGRLVSARPNSQWMSAAGLGAWRSMSPRWYFAEVASCQVG